MALKLPRTIRLDPSDTFVFPSAAEPGEWAVTGTFLFFGADAAALSNKEQQVFRAGFLGINSFGWSTLVVVAQATAAERAAAVNRLAEQLIARCGAPDMKNAHTAAEEEIAFAQSLCDHPLNTLIGLRRTMEGDSIRESFRTLHRRVTRLEPAGAFYLVEVDEEDVPEEEVDIFALTAGQK